MEVILLLFLYDNFKHSFYMTGRDFSAIVTHAIIVGGEGKVL